MTDEFTVMDAQGKVESAALEAIQARHYGRETDLWADAASEHADEQLALAARDLVRAIEALPAADRPVFWDAEVAR